ncbi:MAG TPA: hypothetical protein DCE41_00735 [Cytophagales bacterium]|nr:hypothetical protein [Cytophagales bacterium]HAA23875.1 hypothetical protein [Cytophagales bacterium]HAP64025.1 hypothetical protein [Cytophagales bacterium]
MGKLSREQLLQIGLSENEVDELFEMERREKEYRKREHAVNQSTKKLKYFPVQIETHENKNVVVFDTDEMLLAEETLTEKYDLDGNGHCWISIFENLLKPEIPGDIFKDLIFDAEADSCRIFCRDKESSIFIAHFLHETFKSKKRFDELFGRIDRSKLDC